MGQRRKVKLVLGYDGSNYHGWQTQCPGIITVQQVLEEVAGRTFKHPVKVRGSGRTDAGVHALGQVANFYTDTRMPTYRMAHALNRRLPQDIRIRSAEDVPDNFDAIASASSKLYRYRVYNHTNLPAREGKYCYYYYLPCELERIQRGAELLVGEHDFVSFSSTGHDRSTTVRTLLRCHVERKFHWLYFDLEATGFLYNMVRNIVGTLLDVGRGYIEPEKIKEILAAKDRQAAGHKAPPYGLTLMWVRYGEDSPKIDGGVGN